MMTAKYAPPGVVGAGMDLGRAMREWASTDTGITVIGVTAGVAVGEWLGSMISGYFEMEAGWGDVAAKAVGKGILSFVFFVVGRRTSGLTRVFMNGAAVGSLASVLGDVIAQFTVPGFGLGIGTSNLKGITMKANKSPDNPVGATNKILTQV